MTDVAQQDPQIDAVPARLLEQLFEHSLDGVMLVLPDGTVLRANPAACRMFARTEGELRRLGRGGVVVADQALAALLAARARDGVARGELTYRRPGGTTFPAEVATGLIDAGDGRTVAYVTFRDLTERRKAEAASRERDALYRSLFNLAPIGVLLSDAEGRIVTFNDRAAAQLGYTREEFARLSIGDVDAAESPAEVKARAAAIAAKGFQEFLTRHRTRDGELRDVRVRALALQLDGALAWLSVWEDVTDLSRAEAEGRRQLGELHEREAWLRASQRVARIGHYIFDIPGDRWSSSEVLDEIFGIDAAFQRCAATWLALVHQDDREEMTRYLGALLAGGDRFDHQYRVVTRPGEPERWVHGLGDLTRDEAGRPLRLFGTIQDVTASREAERHRDALAAQLRQAQKLESIGRLAGGVAHDFNNLLVVFLTCADALRQSLAAGEPPSFEDVEELDTAARRARDLTAQLLAFARKQVIAPVPLDLNEVVRRTERLLARLLGEDVELRLDLEPSLWTVCCDPGQLEQVLMNLAVNARDAMPAGGRLTIGTRNLRVGADGPATVPSRPPGRHVVLTVEDTGTGLLPEARAHLFEPFHTTKPAGQGTGLGLATVYGIVTQSGGTIGVQSENGRGTTFEIALPCTDAPATAGPDARPAGPRPANEGRTCRILVVEDDDLVRDATTRVLAGAGYDVVSAAGGLEALALLREASPAPRLLLTDVVMPGMNGQQVAAAVKRHDPTIRVLYMSGYAQDIVVHHGVVDAGIELLEKPFTSAVLLDRVRAVLEA